MAHHRANIGPTWAQHSPKMAQHWPNIEPQCLQRKAQHIWFFIGTSELTLQCRRLSSRSDQNNHREILRINQVRQGKLYNAKVCKPWKLCSWNRNDRHRTIFPCLVSKCLSLNNLWNLRIILKQQEGAMFKSVSGSPNLRVLNNAEQFDHSTMSKAKRPNFIHQPWSHHHSVQVQQIGVPGNSDSEIRGILSCFGGLVYLRSRENMVEHDMCFIQYKFKPSHIHYKN